jgi:3-oxoacid CoA-transferase subunit A
VSLVKAFKADKSGNLVFRRTARNFNPAVAMAGKTPSSRSSSWSSRRDRSRRRAPARHLRAPHRRQRHPEKRIEKRTTAGRLKETSCPGPKTRMAAKAAPS